MPNDKTQSKNHECLNCMSLFHQRDSLAAGTSECFKNQYCSLECQLEDIDKLSEDQIPEAEQNLRTTEESQVAAAMQTIVGGFKIRP